MADVILLFAYGLLGSIAAVSVAFVCAYITKRIDIIDAFWGVAIFASVVAAVIQSQEVGTYAYGVIALVGIWALRLSYYIFRRFLRSAKQDERYTEIVGNWPQSFIWPQVYIRIFLLQAILAAFVGYAASLIIASDTISPWLFATGAAVWVAGFIIESMADRQMAAFVQKFGKKNIVMQTGLWKYSRHPNYFGEVTMWWGVWIISLSTDVWHLALVSPLLITILIVCVSGVPPAERRAASRKGWDEYVKKTSMLVPLPTKNR